jgi:NADH:ubiquinone oxidoreductase subunit 2 (subunit N)
VNIPLFMMAIPALMAVVAYLVGRWAWVQAAAAAVTAAVMGLLALQAPLDQVAAFAGRDLRFESAWVVLGRSFTFVNDDRPALAFIYLTALVFFAGAGAVRQGRAPRAFLPMGLVILSLLTATIFVQPFLFAALFLEMIAACAVIMLADVDHPNTRGAMRLLVFVTLSVPFILLSGWQLEGLVTNPDDPNLLARATILLDIGLFILLAIVPFHSWIPTVSDEASPFTAAFVFTVVQAAVMFFMLKFFNQYDWLRDNQTEFVLLRWGGAVMIVGGGAFAFAQRRFGRLMGYAVMIDIGAALMAVGLATPDGLRATLAILALRVLALAVWGLGLSWLRLDSNSTDFDDLAGRAWQMPFAAMAVVVGGLSLIGFPLTAGFAGRWALYRQLAAGEVGFGLILLLASASVVLAYARGLAALFRREEEAEGSPAEGPREGQVAIIFLLVGVAAILFLGLFPQVLLPAITRAAEAFQVLTQ